jgi:hypothetical protein
MPVATTVTKMAIRRSLSTLLRMSNSGSERDHTHHESQHRAQRRVLGQQGLHDRFLPAAPLYIGTPTGAASGTHHQASLAVTEALKSVGTQPWITAPRVMLTILLRSSWASCIA